MTSILIKPRISCLFSLCIMGLCSLCAFPLAGHAEEWLEKKSKHFIAYYLDDATFASAVIQRAEQYYSRINVELGFSHVVKRDRVPWLDDRRCRIYLYRDQDEFVEATGSPSWSGGKTIYQERIIWSFEGSDQFMDGILPHELAHILFREFVGFNNPRVPLWLDEGVAQYAEVAKREKALNYMKQALEQGVYIPLEKISAVGVGEDDTALAELFYMQSASLVHFLISKYGSGRFIDFCRALRDGRNIERALTSGISSYLDSLVRFEEAWKRYVLKTY